ncbi:MAG: nucleoside deaminase [Propionibacteriaceae bacterium]
MASDDGADVRDQHLLDRAIQIARANVDDGGGPFGAVIIRAGTEVSSGGNRVTPDNDPTAHAEVVAIRAAGAALGTFDLEGCTLYTSCEPCPLCLAATLWARLDRVVFAADRHDAARAGFDDSAFHDLFRAEPRSWSRPVVEQLSPADALAPFEAWRADDSRVAY